VPTLLTDDQYRGRVTQIWGDKIWPTEPYTHSKARIGFQCACGHTWRPVSESIIRLRKDGSGKGCPQCGIKKCAESRRLSTDEYRDRLRSIYGGSISLVGPFNGLEIESIFRCNICNRELLSKPRSLLSVVKKHARFGKCSLLLADETKRHKTCKECDFTKDFNEFTNASSSKDGKQPICKECSDKQYRLTAITDADLRSERSRRRKMNKSPEEEREYREYKTQYQMYRIKTDIQHKLRSTLRNRMCSALKGARRVGRTIELLGCTIAECRTHLERQFKRGMTWENHGTFWHIDHIYPLSKLNLTLASEQRIGFHFTNLQPLKCADNLLKRAKVTNPQMSLCI
jgi:hypothetical protein